VGRFKFTAPVFTPSTGKASEMTGFIDGSNPSHQRAQVAAAELIRRETDAQVDANDIEIRYSS
jgi:hypothetical protein